MLRHKFTPSLAGNDDAIKIRNPDSITDHMQHSHIESCDVCFSHIQNQWLETTSPSKLNEYFGKSVRDEKEVEY